MANSDSEDDIPLSHLKNKFKTSETLSCCLDPSMDFQNPEEVKDLQTDNINEPSTIHYENLLTQGQRDIITHLNDDMFSDTCSDQILMSVSDYDSDKDPEFHPGICELRSCREDVWAACVDCDILLCYEHFIEDIVSCDQHEAAIKTDGKRSLSNEMDLNTISPDGIQLNEQMMIPEHFTVEGSEKEAREEKIPRINKQKEAKKKEKFRTRIH